MDQFTLPRFFSALLVMTIFLLLAYVLKQLLFKKFILPVSLVAGLLALLAGPELLGSGISQLPFLHGKIPDGLLAAPMLAIWKGMPAYLITVVFACLFLGQKIPSTRNIIRYSLPNLTFGYTLALGQYLIGLLLVVLLLNPVFKLNIMAGALVAIGFQGGHGTVAGLQSSFHELGFSEGMDLGLGMATIGIVSAVILGSLLSNISGKSIEDEESKRRSTRRDEKKPHAPFSLQLAVVGLSIGMAWLFLEGLKAVEQALLNGGDQRGMIRHIPLFPVAMLGGLSVQRIAELLAWDKWIDPQKIQFISKMSLDLLVVAALGSLSFHMLANHWLSISILALAGIAYNLGVYFVAGPRLMGNNWKHRALGELGQSMGTTAIGLILLQRNGGSSGSWVRAFSYKQPFYEPVVGGGLITGMALPLIAQFGPWIFMAGAALLLSIIWILTRIVLRK